MAIGGIVAGIGFMLLLSAILAATEKELVENEYITNFLKPFIKGHQEDYRDAGYYYSYQNILESEIVEPEKISQLISQKIEDIAKQLMNIEYQMQLMQQMK